MKEIIFAVLLATASAPLIAGSELKSSENWLESLVRGEFRKHSTDQERYNYLRYEQIRETKLAEGNKGYLSDLTTCSVLAAKEIHLISEFQSVEVRDPALYRDFTYCYYLHNVGTDVSDVEDVKSWVKANELNVHRYYSYERRIEYYTSLSQHSDWDCKNFNSYLREYDRVSGTNHSEIWSTYTEYCG